MPSTRQSQEERSTPLSLRSMTARPRLQIVLGVVVLVSVMATMVAMDGLLLPRVHATTALRRTTTDMKIDHERRMEATESSNAQDNEPTDPPLTDPPTTDPPTTEPPTTSPPTPPPLPVWAWFPPYVPFPKDATLRNDPCITRRSDFDSSVSRDKGIIIPLQNRYVPMGVSLIRELRCLGNRELIQVYFCTPNELSLENQAHVLSQDNRIELIDVCYDLMYARVFFEGEEKNYHDAWLMPLAVHHTDLKEVLVIDANDFLLQDPARIRDSPGYKEHGTMFFYDRVLDPGRHLGMPLTTRKDKPILHFIIENFDYKSFGLTGPNISQQLRESFAYQGKTAHEMHSSLLAIDKTRMGKALDILWWLTTKLRLVHPEFSSGDKESFWLAYELAQIPYAFSPWGVSVVSTAATNDMKDHPETLCGSIAQYMPVNNSSPPELFYVHGGTLVDPLAHGLENNNAPRQAKYNTNASHVTPRLPRMPRQPSTVDYPGECLVGFGSEPLPSEFQRLLLRRKLHFLASASNFVKPLEFCDFGWDQKTV